jgi:multiple sugar transport system ATP-binding protein
MRIQSIMLPSASASPDQFLTLQGSASGKLPTGTQTIGARTEHLDIQKKPNGEASVDWIEHLGDQNRLHVNFGERRITTLIAPDSKFKSGDRVALKLVKPLCFSASGERLG